MTTLYRGDTSRPLAPELTAGTWLTPDPDVAAWYGCAHRYDVDLGRVLDLTALGVGGCSGIDEDEEAECAEAVETALAEAGLDLSGIRISGIDETYQIAERKEIQDAARAAGYAAIRLLQWHADRSDQSYEAVLLLSDRSE